MLNIIISEENTIKNKMCSNWNQQQLIVEKWKQSLWKTLWLCLLKLCLHLLMIQQFYAFVIIQSQKWTHSSKDKNAYSFTCNSPQLKTTLWSSPEGWIHKMKDIKHQDTSSYKEWAANNMDDYHRHNYE